MTVKIVNRRELTLQIVILWSVKESVIGQLLPGITVESGSDCAQFVNTS